MNKRSICTLKILRKLYTKVFEAYKLPKLQREEDPDKVSKMIYDLLSSDKSCMIARFGSTELSTIINYLGVQGSKQNIFKYIKGEALDWWWNPNMIDQMQRWSGFFPPTQEKIEQFCRLMLEDAKEVDILGSWLDHEFYLKEQLQQANLVRFTFLDPFWSKQAWTRVLEGKKVLVIHPFEKTIRQQYEKRKFLFEREDILPLFKELYTIKAIQSLGGNSNEFKDWFEAFEHMKNEMDKIDFDICLIGCGAYGFPLAAHAKRMGKKAVHLGGKLQLLFGIKGKRWENPDYSSQYNFAQFMNEYWVRPSEEEKPETANKVENACYW